MKVYIINRDLLTWPKAMADLLASQGHDPIFVDNASTYGPLLNFYRDTAYQVIHCHNIGPSSPWHVMGPQAEPYAVTDPDLDLSGIPADWPEVLIRGMERNGLKCGFSIRDDDLPWNGLVASFDDLTAAALKHHWAELKDGYYQYPVATRFAVYHPSISVYQVGGTRSAAPYIARHLPWYLTELDEEYYQYLSKATMISEHGGGCSMLVYPFIQELMAKYRDKHAVLG